MTPDPNLPLAGRNALITGASRGIGAAVATRFAEAGARVVLASRDEQALDLLASALPNDPLVVPVDLSRAEAPIGLLDEVLGRVERLNVLVNNAGIFANAPSGELTAEAVETTLAVNVRSPLVLAGRAAAHMAERGGGAIVSVSSVIGPATGVAWASPYAASKAAVDGFTRALAAAWGAAGVRVNAVRPGIVRSTMIGDLLAMPGFEDFYNQNAALGRIGEPGEVADLVAFLASDAARYITGQAITIDGGWADTGAVLPPSAVAALTRA